MDYIEWDKFYRISYAICIVAGVMSMLINIKYKEHRQIRIKNNKSLELLYNLMTDLFILSGSLWYLTGDPLVGRSRLYTAIIGLIFSFLIISKTINIIKKQ